MRPAFKTIYNVINGLVVFLIIILGCSQVSTMSFASPNMSVIKGNWIDVYYETEKDAAVDTFRYAESRSREVAKKLGFIDPKIINIYIYDNQYTFQTKKYGLFIPLLGLDWYIGDNKGTDVLLTSPANPGRVHDYENNKKASLHEAVHAYNSMLNTNMSLWLDEGVALYLSKGKSQENLLSFYNTRIPTFEEIQTNNPIKFNNIGGYYFAYTYIEFLDKTYGWEKVLDLLESDDYQKCFGLDEKSIYLNWVRYINKINSQRFR